MNNQHLRRLVGVLLTLFIAISLNFFLPRWMPGDPLALIAGNAVQQMNAAKKAELLHTYGLDRPLTEQYLLYLNRLAHGDLGQSYRYSGGQSVLQILVNRLGWTFFLISISLVVGTLIGSLLGIRAARRGGTSTDLGLLTLLFTLRSIPAFWLAMMFIPIFAVSLRWFPSGDSYAFPRLAGISGFIDVLHHAFLPVLVLTLAYIPTPFAIMRVSMMDVLGSDYVRAARAKGLSEGRVIYRHAMRNTLPTVVTTFALEFGQLLGGAVLIETAFNYRGIGSMMFEAVKSRDYPLLQGGFLMFTIAVLTINLLTDWIYPWLDPRIRDHAR